MNIIIDGITNDYFDAHRFELTQLVFGRVRMPRKKKKGDWKPKLRAWYLKKVDNMKIKHEKIENFIIGG